jgi:hypothetical protein
MPSYTPMKEILAPGELLKRMQFFFLLFLWTILAGLIRIRTLRFDFCFTISGQTLV